MATPPDPDRARYPGGQFVLIAVLVIVLVLFLLFAAPLVMGVLNHTG
jgi:hypothetical protein